MRRTLDDHVLAAELADGAADLLLNLLEDESIPRDWELERAGDRLAHEFLTQQIQQHRPDDAILSEEGRDDRRRLRAGRVWIVDPLDGSRDFGVSGSWSVHVALCEQRVATAAAVAVPAWKTTFTTRPPAEPSMCRVGRRRILVSRSRGLLDGQRLARALDAEVMAMGSAGVKAMAVVRGEVDAYVHAGTLYEWDVCAPAAVALAAGLHASHPDGTPLRFNNPNPRTAGLVVCRPDFAGELLAALAD